jgi:hypothetical protein
MHNWCGFRSKTGPFFGLESMVLGQKKQIKESSGKNPYIGNMDGGWEVFSFS